MLQYHVFFTRTARAITQIMTIIKLGGSYLNDGISLNICAAFLKSCSGPIAIVHGGGHYIDTLAKTMNIHSEKKEGIRITSRELMDVVDMVLNGKVNTWIVRNLCAMGLPALGFSLSSLHMAKTNQQNSKNFTGSIGSINIKPLLSMISNGILPVISPTAMNSTGEGININADNAAADIAVATKAHSLLYVSDVPGIKNGETLIPSLSTSRADALISEQVIQAGMIAKIRAVQHALQGGVPNVHIMKLDEHIRMQDVIDGSVGTKIQQS